MNLTYALILTLVLACGWVARRHGGPPEKIAATIIVGWIFADAIYHLLFGPSGFAKVDPVHVVLDGAELGGMLWVALRANRMWPLWAAAAQLICFVGHVAALIQPGGMQRAYWVMTQLPQYIQIIALLLGTAAHARRQRRLGGPYRSWRYS